MSFSSARFWALQQVFRGIKNAKGVFFLALMLASLSLTIPVFVASVLYSLSEPIRAIPVAPEITVFTYYQDLSKAQMDNLRERIGRHEHVTKITMIPSPPIPYLICLLSRLIQTCPRQILNERQKTSKNLKV